MIRRIQLHLEVLDGRSLPSVTMPVTPHAALQSSHHDEILSGHGSGAYHIRAGHPDSGRNYEFQRRTTLTGLGRVNVTGRAHSTGFIQNGHATGRLTFTNEHGSVTVELTGPTQPGFAALPEHFHYKVVSGTGAYQHLHSSGTIDLHLSGQLNSGHFTMAVRPANGR